MGVARKKFDLEDRLVTFATTAALFSKELPRDMTGLYYSDQLMRSGGSAALSFGEAQGANTIKDYLYRSTICLRELRESRVNLKILNKLEYGNKQTRDILLNESEQLIKIISSIIRSKKSKSPNMFP